MKREPDSASTPLRERLLVFALEGEVVIGYEGTEHLLKAGDTAYPKRENLKWLDVGVNKNGVEDPL